MLTNGQSYLKKLPYLTVKHSQGSCTNCPHWMSNNLYMSVREANILPKFTQTPLRYEVQCLYLRIILENVSGWHSLWFFSSLHLPTLRKRFIDSPCLFPLLRMSQKHETFICREDFFAYSIKGFSICSKHIMLLFYFVLFWLIRNTFKKIFF